MKLYCITEYEALRYIYIDKDKAIERFSGLEEHPDRAYDRWLLEEHETED